MPTIGGHQLSQHRPAGQNVSVDAARILEEILNQRRDGNLKSHYKVRRIKTGPEKVSNRINGSENVVTRSETLPANYREFLKEEIKISENKAIQDKIHLDLKSQNVDLGGSSADTEDNLSLDSEKRKKKSFLKKAKERLIFTFRRGQKGELGKVNQKSNLDTSNSKTQKNGDIKKKSKLVKGKSVDPNLDNNDADKNRHVSVIKEKSVRKSKESSQVTGSKHPQRGLNGSLSKGVPSPSVNGSSTTQRKTPEHPVSQKCTEAEDSPKSYKSNVQKSHLQQKSIDRNLPSINGEHSSLFTHVPSSGMSADVSGKTPASFSDILLPENISQTPAYSLASIQSSVLDCPGDDIQFIDASDSDNREKHDIKDRRNQLKHFSMVGIQFNGKRDPPNMNLPASPSPDSAHLPDFENLVISTRGTDKRNETTTIKTTPAVLPQNKNDISYDELDGVFDELDGAHASQYAAHGELPVEPENAAPDREVIYSVIAQKLVDMADSYSSSGSEGKTKPSPPEAEKSLSNLEKEIIEYLRSVGDTATGEAKQDIYGRFRSTMQNSLGSELSWNHVAFFFYASKEIISHLGTITREALLAKDFTLQYVNETYLSWITDQGGFDSLVSSDETDFEVD